MIREEAVRETYRDQGPLLSIGIQVCGRTAGADTAWTGEGLVCRKSGSSLECQP